MADAGRVAASVAAAAQFPPTITASVPAGPPDTGGRPRRSDRPVASDQRDGAAAEAGSSAEPSSFGSGSGDYMPAPPSQHDEMFFDPDADGEDEGALRAARGGRESDAHLSCPGCFTTLCVDAERIQATRNGAVFRARSCQSVVPSGRRHGEHEGMMCVVCEADVGWIDRSGDAVFLDEVLESEP